MSESAKKYVDRIVAMTVPSELQVWEQHMKQQYGERVPVWSNKLPPLAALMVIRHGEDVSKWPAEFSDQDVQRARTWAAGETPKAVVWGITH